MSRLIDADALLEKMKRTNRYFSIKFDIEEAPTAYDVDKVVEHLKKCCESVTDFENAFERGLYAGYSGALAIVLKGGETNDND